MCHNNPYLKKKATFIGSLILMYIWLKQAEIQQCLTQVPAAVPAVIGAVVPASIAAIIQLLFPNFLTAVIAASKAAVNEAFNALQCSCH